MKVVGAFEPIEIYQKMPKSIGQHFNVPNKRKAEFPQYLEKFLHPFFENSYDTPLCLNLGTYIGKMKESIGDRAKFSDKGRIN